MTVLHRKLFIHLRPAWFSSAQMVLELQPFWSCQVTYLSVLSLMMGVPLGMATGLDCVE